MWKMMTKRIKNIIKLFGYSKLMAHVFVLTLTLSCISQPVCCKDKIPSSQSAQSQDDSRNTIKQDQHNEGKTEITPLELYRHLFREKRKGHSEAITALLAMEKYEKQYNMVKLVLGKIFSTSQEAKVILMKEGYSPGDPFPTDHKLQDVLSMVIENIVFFGDILLHLPDITHGLLRRNKDWDLMARWGVSFCNETKIYEQSEHKLLNLMAQELDIIDRDPNYVNPYKKSEPDLQKEIEKLMQETMSNVNKQTEKKKKKTKNEKKKKGPRLSNKSEL